MSNQVINSVLDRLLDRQPYHDITEGNEEVSCVGCGCTDEQACIDEQGCSCYWMKVNRATGMGVCSSCPEFLSHPCTPDHD